MAHPVNTLLLTKHFVPKALNLVGRAPTTDLYASNCVIPDSAVSQGVTQGRPTPIRDGSVRSARALLTQTLDPKTLSW
jgi:hypothetical protein